MNSEIILTLNSQELKFLSPYIQDLKAVTTSKEIREGEFKVEFV